MPILQGFLACRDRRRGALRAASRGGGPLRRRAGPRRRPDASERHALRDEAERLWPVSADRNLRLRPGVRGRIGTPVKAVLRKLMRWYVEPLAYDQRSFNAAVLRLIDDLDTRIAQLEAELKSRDDESRGVLAAGPVRARRGGAARGAAHLRAEAARARRRPRHDPVQVVPRRPHPLAGVPLAARRPRGGERPARSIS